MAQDVTLVQAVYNAASGTVRGTLGQQPYGRRALLIAISGPARSTLTIYRGGIPNFAGQITNIKPADVRTYTVDQGSPIDIRPGETAVFDWSAGATGAGQTATANVIWDVY